VTGVPGGVGAAPPEAILVRISGNVIPPSLFTSKRANVCALGSSSEATLPSPFRSNFWNTPLLGARASAVEGAAEGEKASDERFHGIDRRAWADKRLFRGERKVWNTALTSRRGRAVTSGENKSELHRGLLLSWSAIERNSQFWSPRPLSSARVSWPTPGTTVSVWPMFSFLRCSE